MQGQKTTFLRTQLAHHAYTLMADFSGGLHSTFIRRLREVTDSVVGGFLERARYLVLDLQNALLYERCYFRRS